MAALDRHGVERYLVAGDLVGYGPHPNECVERIAGLDALCVAGNHDLIALGRLSDERCIPLARESLQWTRTVLTDDSREYLASLPLRASAAGGVVIAHGSLDDPQEYTTTPGQAVAQLTALTAEQPDARVLLLGHTHRPWAFALGSGIAPIRRPLPLERGDVVLLNPGGVGQSRELRARARFAVLDLEDGQATFFAIPYELDRCRDDLRRSGLSPRSCHIRPSPLGAGRRALRTATSRARALMPGRGAGRTPRRAPSGSSRRRSS
jgi:predicted phosphodiesterase